MSDKFNAIANAVMQLQHALKAANMDGAERVVLQSYNDFQVLRYLMPPEAAHYMTADSLTKKPMHEMTICGVRFQCEAVRSVNAIDPWWEKHIKDSG